MAKNFVSGSRDQPFLLPCDVAEWLPVDHLVWFIIRTVDRIDLSSFYARYRDDGWGRAAYEPKMMVVLLLYAYSVGIRSSRLIEKKTHEDIAFRVAANNLQPDHVTIARFRKDFHDELAEIFTTSLRLALEAGLIKPQDKDDGTESLVVAVDGTKMAANASLSRNVTEEKLRKMAEGILKEAERIDQEEDAKYGAGKRGDEVPGHIKDPEQQIRWIEERLKELEQERERRKADTRQSKQRRELKPTVNKTDPESSKMKGPHGILQGYNAQAVVTENQIVIAAGLTNHATDYGELEAMVSTAQQNLLEIDETLAIDTVVADAGYLTEDNTRLDLGCDILIAPGKSKDLKNLQPPDHPTPEITEEDRQRYEKALEEREKLNQQRVEVIGKLVDKQVSLAEAQHVLNLSESRVYLLKSRLLRDGPESVRLKRSVPKPRGPSGKERMILKFLNEDVRETYKKRGQIIEPVFGQIKEPRGIRRFARRGFEACLAEWKLITATHNFLKVWRQEIAPSI